MLKHRSKMYLFVTEQKRSSCNVLKNITNTLLWIFTEDTVCKIVFLYLFLYRRNLKLLAIVINVLLFLYSLRFCCVSVVLFCNINIYLVSKLECCVLLHDASVPIETLLHIMLVPRRPNNPVPPEITANTNMFCRECNCKWITFSKSKLMICC